MCRMVCVGWYRLQCTMVSKGRLRMVSFRMVACRDGKCTMVQCRDGTVYDGQCRMVACRMVSVGWYVCDG